MIKFYICRGPLYWRQNFEIWTNHGLCLFFFKVNKACYWSKGKTSTSKYFSNLHSDILTLCTYDFSCPKIENQKSSISCIPFNVVHCGLGSFFAKCQVGKSSKHI